MIFLALTLLGAALAAMPADLSGRWILDQERSQSVDGLLAASGASLVERAAAATMSVTQDMRLDGATLIIQVESAVMDREERLPLDGSVVKRTSKRGEPMEVRTSVEGEAVVTRTRITGADGQVSTMELIRRVEDSGATLRQTVRYTPPGEATLTAERVFRRE